MNDMKVDFSATPTILVVDDKPDNLQVMRQILTNQYQTLFAKSGERALELAAEQQPDLILLDVMMPEMDGFETCARLKADSRTHDAAIIFLSALTDPLDNPETGVPIGDDSAAGEVRGRHAGRLSVRLGRWRPMLEAGAAAETEPWQHHPA